MEASFADCDVFVAVVCACLRAPVSDVDGKVFADVCEARVDGLVLDFCSWVDVHCGCGCNGRWDV